MFSKGWRDPQHRRRWSRTAAIVLTSLVFHGAVLGYMGLSRFKLAQDRTSALAPTILLDIEPRPRIRDERPRQPRTAKAAAPASAPTDQHREREEDAPAAPVLRAPAPPPPDAPSPPPDGPTSTARDPALAAAIARSMRRRGGDCYRLAATSAERAECDQSFGAAAERAPPITGTGNRQRDAEFAREGERALRQYDARRRPLSGGTGVTTPADCAGSNFGTGCAGSHLDPSLAPDSRSNIRSPRDGDRVVGAPLTPGAPVPRD